MTPGQYVEWARRQAEELNLSFNGTAQQIERMILERRAVEGEIFLDYDVKGNILSRPGLDSLFEQVKNPLVTHVFIPRRDRLARPDDLLDGLLLEKIFRKSGTTIVYMDQTLHAQKRNEETDCAEVMKAISDFFAARNFRRDLSQKSLYAQLNLAKKGYSTGGRPPYGFCRWLVQDDGTLVRKLAEKERVRMAGCHVVWLPEEQQIKIVLRILEMLESMPASRVAAQLTAEGVPSPDHNRWRTDQGVRHRTSGVWHQTTIVGIARNPLLRAVVSYGRRSMGDKLRFAPNGPRKLEETDYRCDDKPKVIRNAEKDLIKADACFAPIVDEERHQRLLEKLDARGGTQRGKPRSRDPKHNPLGGRIFDMDCCWLMYRVPYRSTYRYRCGLYMQSHGASCRHNSVDGPTATRFVLSCIHQLLLSPSLMAKVKKRLRELAAQNKGKDKVDSKLIDCREQLATLQEQLQAASTNMTLAKTTEQFEVISEIFDKLKTQETSLQRQVRDLEAQAGKPWDLEAEVAGAMDIVQRLVEIMHQSNRTDLAQEAFRVTNARLFLRFQPKTVKKRVLDKPVGGVVAFGRIPDPIKPYQGPTSRWSLKKNAVTGGSFDTNPQLSSGNEPPRDIDGSGLEDKSLGNISRGDRIRTCDLLNPIPLSGRFV